RRDSRDPAGNGWANVICPTICDEASEAMQEHKVFEVTEEAWRSPAASVAVLRNIDDEYSLV
ncbi:MAG TPA: hypothetical protein VLQ20_04735, partial [Planococcus sp. (in: firmicutes)]|nr:hypothetical protein [Planococcus sp. (in: firmicutes)]